MRSVAVRPQMSRRRTLPVSGYLVVAAALAITLPSGLTLPNSGPPTVAEYAPVPGTGAGHSDQGALGQAGSAGLGSGGPAGSSGASQQRTAAPGWAPPEGTSSSVPNDRHCVKQSDGIFHQTEDPLSPPCVTYSAPDNGGPTGAPGVTREEIRVVLSLGLKGATDPTQRDLVDCADAIDASVDRVDDIMCKAYMRFFNARYWTYHRRVHLYAEHGLSGADAIERVHPFAAVGGVGGVDSAFARAGVLAIGFGGALRDSYREHAPYSLSFWPDLEDETGLAASFICRRLARRPASLTTDPSLTGKPRRYGYWGEDQSPTLYDRMVIAAMKSTCGLSVDDYVYGVSHPDLVAKLKADGITTVLANVNTGSLAVVTHLASQAAYFPEWVVPGQQQLTSINTNYYGRTADSTQWRQAIGLTFDYRRDAISDQMWHRAYREACGSCPEPAGPTTSNREGPSIYDSLQLLFYAIQLGGPRLTAHTVDTGLHAIPETASPTPYRPAAYLAPGNYSFLKDAAETWWDPSGQQPGGGPLGCWRLVGGGVRHRIGEWADSTAGLDGNTTEPCQGDALPGG